MPSTSSFIVILGIARNCLIGFFSFAVQACVPEHRAEEVREETKQEADGIWTKIFSLAFGKLLGNTLTLAFACGRPHIPYLISPTSRRRAFVPALYTSVRSARKAMTNIRLPRAVCKVVGEVMWGS